MTEIRAVTAVLQPQPVVDGAGVHIRRGFSHGQERSFDPFLLFDNFGGDTPDQFMAGFPWHPHRGIETITYLLEGDVEHGDSMGNSGVIRPGDVQWMTAGSGIIHQEMPQASPRGRLQGFQLWSNLPASHKMMAPRYQGIEAADIPELQDGAARVKLICGRIGETSGPVQEIVSEPEYLDVSLTPDGLWAHPVKPGHTVFAFLFEGAARFAPDSSQVAAQGGAVVLFGGGEQVQIQAGAEGARFLLVSGQPLREPVAWGGPIVMNTQEELRLAFSELRANTFIKHKGQ